ncbi:MAG: alpha/beta hydrolase, partial [Candidatus Sumerlaeota bacterium]|nr:alpha/beta hydrolase [Candidatus Sumerlaeota bacterium]
INALIAPRPHLGIAGNYDKLTPPSGLDKIDRHLKELYGALGASEAWKLLRYETGHFETADARSAILDWLDRWL